jgi:hypothetical protein
LVIATVLAYTADPIMNELMTAALQIEREAAQRAQCVQTYA